MSRPMTKQSIVSAALAREWLDHASHVPVEAEHLGCLITFRRCAIRGNLSGGAVVRVRDRNSYQHGGILWGQGTVTIRLRPGWSVEALSRAIHRATYSVRSEAPIRRSREALYLALEGRPQEELDRLDDAGRAAGRATIYEDMTAEDVEFYRELAGTKESDMNYTVTYDPGPDLLDHQYNYRERWTWRVALGAGQIDTITAEYDRNLPRDGRLDRVGAIAVLRNGDLVGMYDGTHKARSIRRAAMAAIAEIYGPTTKEDSDDQ